MEQDIPGESTALDEVTAVLLVLCCARTGTARHSGTTPRRNRTRTKHLRTRQRKSNTLIDTICFFFSFSFSFSFFFSFLFFLLSLPIYFCLTIPSTLRVPVCVLNLRKEEKINKRYSWKGWRDTLFVGRGLACLRRPLS